MHGKRPAFVQRSRFGLRPRCGLRSRPGLDSSEIEAVLSRIEAENSALNRAVDLAGLKDVVVAAALSLPALGIGLGGDHCDSLESRHG